MDERWYLYRDGTKVVLAHVSQQGALLLHDRGHELGDRPYSSREEAEEARIEWMDRLISGDGSH
jgi:hypothetical protein